MFFIMFLFCFVSVGLLGVTKEYINCTALWAIPRCRTYLSDTYFMPGALTGNENYIKLLQFHTHHLTVSCGKFEYFVSFTHIGYEPK